MRCHRVCLRRPGSFVALVSPLRHVTTHAPGESSDRKTKRPSVHSLGTSVVSHLTDMRKARSFVPHDDAILMDEPRAIVLLLAMRKGTGGLICWVRSRCPVFEHMLRPWKTVRQLLRGLFRFSVTIARSAHQQGDHGSLLWCSFPSKKPAQAPCKATATWVIRKSVWRRRERA
ncbi:hypothetical protein VUR80DRAFT_5200 [Thermomyces stellatus]